MSVREWERVRYDIPAERVARITLTRAEAANAQDFLMLSQLNEALDIAARDDDVRVIVLAAEGRHFSSGHDLSQSDPDMDQFPAVGNWCHFDGGGAEGHIHKEAEMFVGLCWRWRNIPKPTIASVQGKVIAGGLMLVWPMDMIVAAENTTFSDPVTAFNVNGVEYFVHPFEAGSRLAKEMLFTGRSLGADELYQRGMVNKVVSLEDLESETIELASHIAKRPMFGLTLAKQSVNNSLDAMGMYTTIQSAFGLHHVAHSSNMQQHGMLVDPAGLKVIRDEA
jgi:enoyl-CoA hydratase